MNTTPFDLGNLSALKVGDEVTTLDLAGNVASRVLIVRQITERGVQVRLPHKDAVAGFWHHRHAGGFAWAMHNPEKMQGYYSANPEHVAQAKANAKAERQAEEARKAAFAILFEQAKPIGEALGDGWQSGSNGGDDWYSTSAAHTLAERLTSDQMKTLAGWLKIA